VHTSRRTVFNTSVQCTGEFIFDDTYFQTKNTYAIDYTAAQLSLMSARRPTVEKIAICQHLRSLRLNNVLFFGPGGHAPPPLTSRSLDKSSYKVFDEYSRIVLGLIKIARNPGHSYGSRFNDV